MRNTFPDVCERASRLAAFDAAIMGKTARLRMMEHLQCARSIDEARGGPVYDVCEAGSKRCKESREAMRGVS